MRRIALLVGAIFLWLGEPFFVTASALCQVKQANLLVAPAQNNPLAAQTGTAPDSLQHPGLSGESLPDTPGGRFLALLGRKRITTPGERELAYDSSLAYRDPLNWAVTVYKSRHQLIVYYKGRMFRTYHAVFGRYPDPGPKLYEGDLRTPEGLYAIVGKYPHRRWRRFLKLNYPNAVDRQHHAQAISEGMVPLWHGRPAPIGGAVGIHGTDAPWLNRANINWTAGCISVDNDSILELDQILPVGALVLIKP